MSLKNYRVYNTTHHGHDGHLFWKGYIRNASHSLDYPVSVLAVVQNQGCIVSCSAAPLIKSPGHWGFPGLSVPPSGASSTPQSSAFHWLLSSDVLLAVPPGISKTVSVLPAGSSHSSCLALNLYGDVCTYVSEKQRRPFSAKG